MRTLRHSQTSGTVKERRRQRRRKNYRAGAVGNVLDGLPTRDEGRERKEKVA